MQQGPARHTPPWREGRLSGQVTQVGHRPVCSPCTANAQVRRNDSGLALLLGGTSIYCPWPP